MTAIDPRFYLITPVLDDPAAFVPALAEACATGQVMAVLIRLAAADERRQVQRVKAVAPAIQHHGAAAIVADPGGSADLATIVTRGGADGAHAEDPGRLHELCERLKEGRNVGAGGLRSKHDAMVAGEIGVDYVMFGEPRPDGFVPDPDLAAERAAWWAEIFQTPCAVFAPSLAEVGRLGRTGAEFIALGDAVWTHPEGPAKALAAAQAALSDGPEPSA